MAKRSPQRDTFLEFVLEQLSALEGGDAVTARAMMGGQSLFCDGVIFALIGHGALYLKADDLNRSRFEALGLPAFCPDQQKPASVMQYYLVPAGVLEDRQELARWAGEAVEAGRRSASTRKPRAKREGRAGISRGKIVHLGPCLS